MSNKYENAFRSVRAVIDTPEKWTKKQLARNIGAAACQVHAAEAVCFCLMGACCKASISPDESMFVEQSIGNILPLFSEYNNYVAFNDDRKTTHADVMNLLDMAILNCELAGV
jgi:hypothetical protein